MRIDALLQGVVLAKGAVRPPLTAHTGTNLYLRVTRNAAALRAQTGLRAAFGRPRTNGRLEREGTFLRILSGGFYATKTTLGMYVALYKGKSLW